MDRPAATVGKCSGKLDGSISARQPSPLAELGRLDIRFRFQSLRSFLI